MAVLMPMISPAQIHQGSAAIAGIDGGVGLQKVLELPPFRSTSPKL